MKFAIHCKTLQEYINLQQLYLWYHRSGFDNSFWQHCEEDSVFYIESDRIRYYGEIAEHDEEIIEEYGEVIEAEQFLKDKGYKPKPIKNEFYQLCPR